jgi:hypothetical protein
MQRIRLTENREFLADTDCVAIWHWNRGAAGGVSASVAYEQHNARREIVVTCLLIITVARRDGLRHGPVGQTQHILQPLVRYY